LPRPAGTCFHAGASSLGDSVDQGIIAASQGRCRRSLGRLDGRGKLLAFGQPSGQGIEGPRLPAAGKLDRSGGQFGRVGSIADRGIGTRRQNPGRLPQHQHIVGLKLNCLMEMSQPAP
jgi:hypothetical protein